MPLSNNVIGCINIISVLLSIPVIGSGIWLTTGPVNSCVMLLQWPVIILGILILLVGLAGFIGGFWRITWLLVVYLIAMLALVVLLGVLVGFIYMVTLRGSGRTQPSRAYLEYSLEDFSGFLRRRVETSYKWESIRSCLSTTSICPDLNQRFTLAQDFFNAYLDPIQVRMFYLKFLLCFAMKRCKKYGFGFKNWITFHHSGCLVSFYLHFVFVCLFFTDEN